MCACNVPPVLPLGLGSTPTDKSIHVWEVLTVMEYTFVEVIDPVDALYILLVLMEEDWRCLLVELVSEEVVVLGKVV